MNEEEKLENIEETSHSFSISNYSDYSQQSYDMQINFNNITQKEMDVSSIISSEHNTSVDY